jgi:hypothetical protein
MKFIYMGMTVTDADETKNRLNSTDVYGHLGQNCICSGFVSKKVKKP